MILEPTMQGGLIMSSKPVAIVTAASKGIGAACARRLAADNWNLVVLSSSEKIFGLAREIDGVAVQGSVTCREDLEKCIQAAMERWDRIDAVVNNTGHPPKGDLLDLTDKQWLLGLDLVFMNVVRMARLATPLMLRRGRGVFVNISSFGASEPDGAFPVSSCFRAALGAYAKLFSDRYASAGIRMNNVLPGYVETYPVDEKTRAAIATGRPARVEEIAATVAFLLSDGAGYITGRSILVDGGLCRGF